jgi:hypothetical protein
MIWKPKPTQHYDYTRMTDRQIAIELQQVQRELNYLARRIGNVEYENYKKEGIIQ